ncbi:MAG: hypothetical protein HY781_00110 [Chloroflexi bacterium]|nr:hypothetical protein [Chloroflexota bacterium]
MDAFFLDPNVERLPPEATRFLDLRAESYPDGRRIRIGLELTPFQKRPNIELTLADSLGRACGSASIVEPMGWKLELTLHIRSQTRDTPALSAVEGLHVTPGAFTLTALLSYPDLGEIDRRQVSIQIPASEQP